MGIIDEEKDKSDKTKPPLLPKPCTSSVAGSTEHAIPQMIITSADDVSQEIQNAQEAQESYPAPTSPSSEDSVANIHVEKKVEDSVVIPKLTEVKPDVVIKTSEEEPTNLSQSKTESKSAESITHSVIQRPLIIESERSVSPPTDVSSETDSKCSSPVSPSPIPSTSSAPSAMQRPLVFDSSVVAQTDTSSKPIIEQENIERGTVTFELSENQDAFKGDLIGEEPHDESDISESPTFIELKPKSSSFSWMPSFPKLHASNKETKPSSQDQYEKSGVINEQKQVDEISSVKKDKRLQNMKKFFDSILHEPAQETKDKTKVRPESMIISDAVHKEQRHGLKRFFSHPSKLDTAAEEKSTTLKMSESHAGNLEIKSSSKESRGNVKKFFDSFKIELVDSKVKHSDKNELPSPESKEDETDVSKVQHKDSKHGLKKFFDSFKHDVPGESSTSSLCRQSDNQDIEKSDFADQKINLTEGIEASSELKESIESSKGQQKDSKHGLKNFFDSFKHDAGVESVKSSDHQEQIKTSLSEQEIKISEQSEFPSPIKDECSDVSDVQHKDSKHGLKKFFDTFKHDAGVESVKSSDHQEQLKTNLPRQEGKISEQSGSLSSPIKDECSDASNVQHKDSKHGLKKFFDSFKHDSGVEAVKSSDHQEELKTSLSNQEVKISEQSASPSIKDECSDASNVQHKDSKHGLKKFFDSFKHDVGVESIKSSDHQEQLKTSLSEKEVKISEQSESPSMKDECSDVSNVQHKDSKHGLKKFFDSFKHDTCEKDTVSTPAKSLESSAVDIDQNKLPTPELKGEFDASKPQHKDSKHGLKKFFDSFKHDSESLPPKSLEGQDSIHMDIQGKESAGKVCKPAKSESDLKEHHTDGLPTFKKMFDSFKHSDTQKELKIKVHQDSELHEESKSPDKTAEVTSKDNLHGVKKFFDSFKHSTPDETKSAKHQDISNIQDESNKEQKDSLPGVKKFFDSFKIEGHEMEKNAEGSDHKKKCVKRSQSCKETTVEKEGRHIGSVKSFFDSLGQKNAAKVSSQSHIPSAEQNEHIYDIVEVPRESTSGAVEKEPISAQVETVKKLQEKQGESHQNVKKLFDIFHHKDSKPSVDKAVEKEKKVTEKTDVSSDFSRSEVMPTADKGKEPVRDHFHGVKKFIDSFMQKDATAVVVSDSSDSSKLDKEQKSVPTIQIDESHSVDSKASNLERTGTKLTDDSKFEVIDLRKTGISKPSGSSSIRDKFSEESIRRKGEAFAPDSKKIAEKKGAEGEPSQQPVVVEPSCVKTPKKKPRLEPGTPETLYDTCCLRIATLLQHKALEIVSEKTKSPPKKPPKPSAEAIAKARANAVSRRLKEMQNTGRSLGENIPVGLDGIRFADDETESSCDYKDVENFDYIMDYELLNRYKFDSKLDTCSVPSDACSGITSFYTADTVTLRSETFSDAALETVSLDSNDFRHLTVSQSKSESETIYKSEVKDQKKQQTANKLPNTQKEIISEGKQITSRTPTSNKSAIKKVPPPLPPKPVLLPERAGIKRNVLKIDEKSSSQCINGLSLSPRIQAKFSKDSARTQKRPLMVADVKETEFTSLSKSKDAQKKQIKDRKFETVLRNESLKSIPSVSSHPSLVSTKSSPAQFSPITSSSSSSLIRKISPPRPPPPLKSADQGTSKLGSGLSISSPVEKLEEGTSASTTIQKEKRTVSPPRPPPPVFSKQIPQRPPPPVVPTKPIRAARQHECPSPTKIEEGSCPYCSKDVQDEKEAIVGREKIPEIEKGFDTAYGESTVTDIKPRQSTEEKENVEEKHVPIAVPQKSDILESDSTFKESKPITDEESKLAEESIPGAVEHSTAKESISVTVEENTPVTIEESPIFVEKGPKPPPRTRRIRSRTVEIVPVEKVSRSRLRRSQSLSEIDVEIKLSELRPDIPQDKSELKSLYTAVNKDVKKSSVFSESADSETGSSSLDRVSSRPLPAPPPPPRRFRSLDRQPKQKNRENGNKFKTDEERAQGFEASEAHDIDVKPPARKSKMEKRFHSLGSEVKHKNGDKDSKITRSSSMPLKPERRLKHVRSARYDENANVAFPVVAEVHAQLDECGNEILDSSFQNIPVADVVDSPNLNRPSERSTSPTPHHRKDKATKKSHSSWYDENETLEGAWEVVDWSHTDVIESQLKQPRMPLRRKSDPGKKTRQTSKFYVDVDIESGKGLVPLVDKETSPLPLDYSEKSVQTSLETLSQGVVSRDENSEDTDELLDLAQTLQNELKVIINRHKTASEDIDNESNTPPASATDSEKNLDENLGSNLRKAPSIRSSTSELWPMTSSEESDGEAHATSSLTEMAMTRKQKKIFYIAQEIMTSEEVFVDALKLLNVDFKAAVDTASKQRNSAVIPDDILSQILNHLPQLQHLNENLLSELKDRIENWDKTGKIADIIVKTGPFLKLYSWYIHDFESNVALLEDAKKKYPLFAQVIKEFEMSSRCKRLALNHFMLKPIQRIPQYRLLLQEYLHHLPEDSPDYQDTVTALQIVSEVATHANESMKQGDNAQKLICLQNSIMGHKEIIKPGRIFIKEGELMKLSRKGMQPRWFVLFNDLLLYLTPVQQGLYRVNHELPLTGMKVAIPIQQDYQNEFSIISVTRSFTLAARSQEERQEWIISLTKAIEENASKRSTFTNIRLQQKAQERSSEDDDGTFILGKKAPVWVPDARVTMCQLCTSEFTVTFRRHHCRACGKVVCSVCSSNRISLPYLGNRIARVCDECHARLGPGTSGCTESGETDSDNQQIAVKSHLRTEHRHTKKGKRNLPSVLKEVCANDQGSTISGYLQKRTGKSWKKDWFVVKDKVLYEYKASEDVAALRSIPLLGYHIETFSEAYENVDPSLLFQLTHPGQSPIIFHADTIGATERWVAALREASVLE